MKIKTTKNKIFCFFCMYFISFLLNTAMILNVDNGHQIAFSQGYIPPPISNFKSAPIQCPNIIASGPTYVGPDGCTRPCPNNTNDPNINTGAVFIPQCHNQNIANQSIGIGTSKPIINCPNIIASGPTYVGPDGCTRPCPTSGEIPQGCPINPIGKGTFIGNQSGGGQYSKDNPCVSAQVYTGPTYRDQEFGCPKPCPTSGEIPQGCPPQVGIIIDNQSINTLKSK